MTLRTRLLRPRWLTVALVLWAAVWLTLPAPADGAPLPPVSSSPGSPVDGAAVEAGILREALAAQGLSAAHSTKATVSQRGRSSRVRSVMIL